MGRKYFKKVRIFHLDVRILVCLSSFPRSVSRYYFFFLSLSYSPLSSLCLPSLSTFFSVTFVQFSFCFDCRLTLRIFSFSQIILHVLVSSVTLPLCLQFYPFLLSPLSVLLFSFRLFPLSSLSGLLFSLRLFCIFHLFPLSSLPALSVLFFSFRLSRLRLFPLSSLCVFPILLVSFRLFPLSSLRSLCSSFLLSSFSSSLSAFPSPRWAWTSNLH